MPPGYLHGATRSTSRERESTELAHSFLCPASDRRRQSIGLALGMEGRRGRNGCGGGGVYAVEDLENPSVAKRSSRHRAVVPTVAEIYTHARTHAGLTDEGGAEREREKVGVRIVDVGTGLA